MGLLGGLFDHRGEFLDGVGRGLGDAEGEGAGDVAVDNEGAAVGGSGDLVPAGVVGKLGRVDEDREGGDDGVELLGGQLDGESTVSGFQVLHLRVLGEAELLEDVEAGSAPMAAITPQTSLPDARATASV